MNSDKTMTKEEGCIITVERKFSLQTTFLDLVLRSEGTIQPSETRMDAILRVNKELEETAARLRKEVGTGQVLHQEAPFGMNMMRESTQVIDYKRIEQFEKDIDNAQTSEELEAVVKSVETFPGRVLSTINAKRQSFKP